MSIVSHSFVHDNGLSHLIVPCNLNLKSFTSTPISTRGMIKLPLHLAGVATTFSFVVCDNMQYNFLIGLDFMESNSLVIDTAKRLVSSPCGDTPYFNRPESLPVPSAKIRCAKTVTLSPNSVHFISGRVDSRRVSKDKSYQALVEPYINCAINMGTLVAGAIALIANGSVPIQCIQTRDEPVTLYKNQLLGFVKPVNIENDVHSITSSETAPKSQERIESGESNASDCSNTWTRESLDAALSLQELEISDDDRQRLSDIVWSFRDCFSVNKFDLGTCTTYKAKIELKKDYVAKWIPSRPVPYKLQPYMDAEIKGLLKAKVIEPCNVQSKWNSQIFLVEKNQPGKYRFVCDMRSVNSQCLPDSYELSNINHVLDKVGRCKYWSSLDFTQSFHQIEYEESSKPVCAFMYKGTRYMFSKMAMGHRNSSSNFSRMLDKLLCTVPIQTLCYFVDDLLLASISVSDHLDKLILLLERFRTAGLKLSPSKCKLLQREVHFVGITINQNGISINKDRVKAISELGPPTTRKELMSVLGVFSYNRKFIAQFADKAKPLYDLLKKENSNRFIWGEACQRSFNSLKSSISTSPCLAIPDVEDPLRSYELHVDASGTGYGAYLSQIIDGERRIVAYYSKSVPVRKRKLGACKKEFLAMHSAILHFKQYLKGTEFVVVSDCKALTNLSTLFNTESSNMQRKIADLASFNFSVRWTEGSSNVIPDFLSRYQMKTKSVSVHTQTCHSSTNASTQSVEPQPSVFNNQDSQANVFNVSNTSKKLPNRQVQSIASTNCICAHFTSKHEMKFFQKHQEVNQTPMVSNVNSTSLDQPSIEPLSKEDILEHQSKDIIIKEVLKWVKKGSKPNSFQAHQSPQELVTFWKSFTLLEIKDGILCRKWVQPNTPVNNRHLIVVPTSLQTRALQIFHDSNEMMHAGVETCLNRCRKLYWWPKMETDFQLYIAACIKCNSIKQPRKYLKAPLQCILYSHFNQAVCIDHIVPEMSGSTPRNNRYILTIVDMYTGYIMALPTKTQKSSETIQLILKHWVFTFGLFQELLHDNAPGFTSEFFAEVLKAFNIKNTRGTTYKSATTGKVERSNKKINNALRAAIPTNELNNWDSYLGLVCMSLNSIKNRHTNFSPYFLVFSREPIFPSQLMVCNEEPILTDGHKQRSLQRKLAFDSYRKVKLMVHRVRENAQRDYQYILGSSNDSVRGPFFEEGDHCFVLIDCPVHKFGKRWHGPYCIKKRINDHLYIIPIGGKEKVINLSKLKPYHPNRFSPITGHNKEKSRVTSKQCNDAYIPACDYNPPKTSSGGDITITTNVIPEHINRPRVPNVATHRPLTPATPPAPSPVLSPVPSPAVSEERITQDVIDHDQRGDESSNRLDHLPGTSSQAQSGIDADDTPENNEGEPPGIIFDAIDPPSSRPTRNPQPIDRLSYPASHVKDQRLKRLTKWKR